MLFGMTALESWFIVGITLLAAVTGTFVIDKIMDIIDERSKHGRA